MFAGAAGIGRTVREALPQMWFPGQAQQGGVVLSKERRASTTAYSAGERSLDD